VKRHGEEDQGSRASLFVMSSEGYIGIAGLSPVISVLASCSWNADMAPAVSDPVHECEAFAIQVGGKMRCGKWTAFVERICESRRVAVTYE
jgi:hypothetical protein